MCWNCHLSDYNNTQGTDCSDTLVKYTNVLVLQEVSSTILTLEPTKSSQNYEPKKPTVSTAQCKPGRDTNTYGSPYILV